MAKLLDRRKRVEMLHLAIRSPPHVGIAALNFIPHALHFCEAIELIAVLGELCSHCLCGLYSARPEQRLGRRAVQIPAQMPT